MNNRYSWVAVLAGVFVIGVLVIPTVSIHRVGAQQTSVVNGIPNQNFVMPGLLPIYDLSGTVIVNAKCFQGPVTSAATTGQWSAPNSPTSLGLTSITSVSANVISPGGSLTSLAGQYGINIQNATLSAVNGTVTSPVVIVLGGISIGFGPTAATVYVRFCGSSV